MKTPRLLPSLLLGVLLAPALAEGCVCAVPKPLCHEYSQNSTVFAGVVLEETYSSEVKDSSGDYVVRFQVEEAFRGVDGAEVTLRTPESTCTFLFDKGRRYLVFANRDEKTGNIEAWLCSYTALLDEPETQEVLRYIRGLQGVQGGGRIYGTVLHVPSIREGLVPLVGVRVDAAGPSALLRALSNAQGQFELEDLPPGKYRVTADIPPTLGQQTQEVEVFSGSCAELDFIARHDGRVRGRVVDKGGAPVRQAWVQLAPADPDLARDRRQVASSTTNEEGNYEFDFVPPGEYVVGLNVNRAPDLQTPFPATYYPGVADRQQAIVLQMDEGATIEDIEIQVPPPLRKRGFTVEVRWPDGTPAIGADVVISPWFPQREWEYSGGRISFTLLEGQRYRIRARLRQDNGEWVCSRAIPVDTSQPVRGVALVLDTMGESCESEDSDPEEE